MTAITRALLVFATVTLAAGCAADPQAAASEPRPQAEYRTGSNIPVRGSRPTSDAERARAQAELDELRRSSTQPAK